MPGSGTWKDVNALAAQTTNAIKKLLRKLLRIKSPSQVFSEIDATRDLAFLSWLSWMSAYINQEIKMSGSGTWKNVNDALPGLSSEVPYLGGEEEALEIIKEDLRRMDLTDQQRQDVLELIQKRVERSRNQGYGPGSGNRNIFDRDVTLNGTVLDTEL